MTGIEVIEDLEFEFNIIKEHHNRGVERRTFGNLVFNSGTMSVSDDMLICRYTHKKLSHSLYRMYKNAVIRTNRINANDIYDDINIVLYKNDVDYRFQIDSIHTLSQLEWHISRVLFHKVFDCTEYSGGSLFLNNGNLSDLLLNNGNLSDLLLGRKRRLNIYREEMNDNIN